jgi:putative ABC transport system permease protein
MIPVSYSLRNLTRRRLRTTLTIAGVALVVMLIAILNAFSRGVTATLTLDADDTIVYLLSFGAESDPIRSAIDRGQAETAVVDMPGVYEDAGGRYTSIEVYQVGPVQIPARDDAESSEVVGIIRGVTAKAYLLHPQVFIMEGREPRGDKELMVGEIAPARMGLSADDVAVGNTIRFEGVDWTIVGHFAAPGSPLEAELWCDLEDLMDASRRTDVTLITAKLTDPDEVDYVELFCQERTDLQLMMQTKEEWSATLLALMQPIALISQALALMVLIGGVIACANTLYANAITRTQELATLQIIGFKRSEMAGTLLVEGVTLTLLAGLIGVTLAQALGDIPLRMPMGAIRISTGPLDVGIGLLAALGIGIIGALFPAWRVSRQPLVTALKS